MEYIIVYNHHSLRGSRTFASRCSTLQQAGEEFAKRLTRDGVFSVRLYENKVLIAKYEKEGLKNE